jgi:hypothetical protein
MSEDSVYKVIAFACCVAGILAATSSADGQLKREDFQRADKATIRLSPTEFPDLPVPVRAALENRGCTIPQPYDNPVPKKNVITGQFHTAGQTDWAVLCSHEGHSTILVFSAENYEHIDEIAEEPDLQYQQVLSDGRTIGYSRLLTAARPNAIRRVTHPRPGIQIAINHDGIENTFLEKGSVFWYCANQRWMKVSTTD